MNMKKTLITIVVILGIVVIFGAGIIVDKTLQNFKIESKTTYTSSAVLERVKAVSELNTVEMYFNDVIDYSDSKYFKEFKLPFTTKKVLFTAKARVKAGVDLSKLNVEDIQVNEGTIEIVLPRPTITSKEILESGVYDEQDGAFNKVTSEDTLKLLEEYTVQLDQKAMESGIMDKAETNTKIAVMSLLQLMEFKEIYITFKD